MVAFDIATVELQGLFTCEWFFDDKTYFERVLTTMGDPAFASDAFDYVVCAQVLHHNNSDELRTTLRELYRVLKPGGRLLVICEPMRFLNDLKRDAGAEVAQFDGHENIYFFHEYLHAIRMAGFRGQTIPPQWPTFTGEPLGYGGVKAAVLDRLRSHRPTRAVLLAKARLFGPDHTFAMIAEKPQG